MAINNDFTMKTFRDDYFAQLEKELQMLIDPTTGKLRREISTIIPCPNCESEAYTKVFEKNGFEFVSCNQCDLVYANPQVHRSVILDLYKGASEADNLWTKVLLSDEQKKFNEHYYHEVLDIIQKFIPKGKLLDIGCSIGTFMHDANSRGFECTGLELNDAAAQIALESGLHVERKTIEEYCPSKGEYQIMTLFGVLEHLNNPKQVLDTIYRSLDAGGFLFIHVPNLHSLVTAIRKEQSKTFDGRNHLIYFSIDTLKRMAESVGFQTVYYDTCISGVDQIVRHLSYGMNKVLLNDKARAFLANNEKLERCIKQYDLGYRIRMMVKKG